MARGQPQLDNSSWVCPEGCILTLDPAGLVINVKIPYCIFFYKRTGLGPPQKCHPRGTVSLRALDKWKKRVIKNKKRAAKRTLAVPGIANGAALWRSLPSSGWRAIGRQGCTCWALTVYSNWVSKFTEQGRKAQQIRKKRPKFQIVPSWASVSDLPIST